MKRKYLRVFVCRQFLLLTLLSFYGAGVFAQPSCAVVPKGKITSGDLSFVCPGNILSFNLQGSAPDNSVLFFLERTESLSVPFSIANAPVTDPNTPITAPMGEGTGYFRFVVFCLYNQTYTPISDTLTVTTRKSMSGIYTINSALTSGGRVFSSFTEAVEELKSSCITGPVVFNVTSTDATYKEQITIPQLNGTSDINTITFNGNGNTISYSGTGYYDNRHIIKLDGADHIIIDSLNINGTTGQSGIGVVLTNDADKNIIRRCTINVGVNSSSGYMGINVTGYADNDGVGGSNCDDNIFERNLIIGGFLGISIGGDANRNQVLNNDIRDAQSKAIAANGTRETLISGNKISRPKRTVLGYPFSGMEINSDNHAMVIRDNRIFNLGGGDNSNTGTLYGINFTGCDADPASPNRVFNNLFYNFNGAGQVVALYNGSSDNVYYYHNTIHFDNTVSQTSNQPSAGLFLNATVEGVEFKNNIISIQRGGAGFKYGIYKRTETILCNSDYNDLFLLSDASYFVGFAGSGLQGLSAWQTKTGGDLATVLMDPMFLNAKEGNFKPNNLQLDNKGTVVGVSEDFDLTARNGSTPDIGAYEFAHLVCSSPPDPGTVSALQNIVCSAASASLSVTGGELGDGISYQWQSSSDGTVWNNIASATAKETVVTQTADTWYRLVTTCGTGSTPSDKVLIQTQFPISGRYTINKAVATGGRNFQSFGDAWNAVKCGITGPVEFDVVPGSGPYMEQLITSPVAGMSAVNTITFLGNGNTLEFESDNAFERATVKLNGTDHLIIDSLIIKATATGSGRYAYGVHLTNDADSNIIRRCAIYSDTAMGMYDWGYSAIVVNGPGNINPGFGEANSDGNVFEYNTVVGGYYGIVLAGSSSSPNRRNVIRGNNFINFLNAGVQSSYASLLVVDSNYFSRPTRTGTSIVNGIFLNNNHVASTITRNRIFNLWGGNPSSTDDYYGIQLNNADASPANANIISNNVIYNTSGGGTVYGLYNWSSDYAWYYHNTVHIDGSGSYDAHGLYQSSQAAGIVFRDNIVTLNRSGDGKKYGMYLATPATVFISDYNNFFIQSEATNANIAYLANANRKSVANIQLNGNDAHSTSVDPVYQNLAEGNLQPKNGAIDNAGLPVSVAVDVNGVARNATNPDIGAYEFTAAPCAGGVTAGTAVPGSTEICEGTKMELNLSGNSIGGGQTYQWEASASATGGFGAVSAAQQTPTYYFTPDVNTIYYRAAVTCNGVTSYTQPVTFTVNAMLPGGIYTIDKNGTGDFKSFNEAKAAMACGIKGPVIFNVLPGGTAYEEQLLLDTIVGASAINTVTFRGNGDTILYSSSDYDAPAVIAMNKTDYVTFDSLVISAMGTGNYGVGVWIGNQANNNTFRKCTILIPQTSSSSSYNGVIIGSSATSPTSTSYTQDFYNSNNLFERNTIIGGYCGMSMQGSIYGAVSNNRFIGNTVTDVYSYGIYTAASVNPVIDSNIISRPARKTIGIFYGIYASGSSSYPISMNHGMRINGNRIHTSAGGNRTSTSAAYGIYLTTTTAASLTPATVSNNLIYKFNGAGAEYGIYNSNAGNVRYYHNTISLDNKTFAGTTAAYGIYMNTAAAGVEIKNNIVSVSRSGTGVRYAMYFPSSATFVSDYNNIWVEPGTNRFVGYFGSAKATLADWKAIALANTDKNSVSVYPSYADSANGKYNSVLTELDNTGTPVGITADINKGLRSTVTPDLGAYESSTAPCTAPPVAGTTTVTPSSLSCMGGNVTLTLTGNSTGGNQKYVWQRATTDAGPWANITDSLALPDYAYQVNEKQAYFRAAVACGTGITYSNIVPLTVSGGLDAGDYTIDPSLPSGNRNFLSFNEAVSAMLCGINGSIRVLVAPGFYKERVRVPRIPGAGAGSTVTFLSRENAAASVVLTDSCTIDSNYVVKLDTTSYIIFKNLTIKPIGADYARAVVITGASATDSITGCIIPLPAVQNTSENVVGIYGKELLGSNLVVTKNTISGGMAGIYLEGAEPFAQDFVLDSNYVSGGYWYSVYARNLLRVSVSGNTIARSGIQNVYSYGLYLQKCDSAIRVNKNNVTITNTATSCSAIQLFVSTGATEARGSVSGNIIHADASNTGDIYGVRAATNAANFTAMNNVVVIATGGVAYGIYSVAAGGGVHYYSNSVLIESKNLSGAAAFISDGSDKNGGTVLYNNVLANTGGGLAMSMYNTLANGSDYNMYYSSGDDLFATSSGRVTNLKEWQARSSWDLSSIVYKPSFADNITLKPDVTRPEVWAMHGRGAQLTEDNVDINGNQRPVTFETGVPDLGAYEFSPTTAPVALTAVPAVPVPNQIQSFMLGTDTVTQISWGSIVPSTVEGKRYSGVSPEGLQPNQPFMYFYTTFTYTGTAPKDFGVKQFYVNSWRGLIPKESMIKLGRSNAASGWDISNRSRLDTIINSISDIGLGVLAKYTGLTDGKEAPTNPVVISFRDSSNRGTMFWVPYSNTASFNTENQQNMTIYLGAGAKEAHVTVRVNGTPWAKQYTVPAFGAITTDAIPKIGAFDARLLKEGWSSKGISIQSDVPIAAYAHIRDGSNSGAAMLMPVGTYGYEYYALTGRQTYNALRKNASVATVIAAYDSTVVEITPSVNTQGNRQAGVPFTVTLQKGEIYQLLGAIDDVIGVSYDLTGTKFRSVKNENGKCWPIAVFSGSSLTGFDCSLTGNGGTGDNLFQQNFPYQAWGKRYLTAPLSHFSDAKRPLISLYRVSVKDASAVVKVNGNVLTDLVNNSYYEFASNTADYITSDKPIMVAQFETSASVPHCGNPDDKGDPEMFYLSPIEQGVKETQLYRNTAAAIDFQFLTLVVPTRGLQSLIIDGTNSWDFDYPHPNMPGYSVVVVRWVAASGQAFVKCDSAFTGITYGMGRYESYGYNAGTNVFNLNTRVALNNTHTQAGGSNDYTCAGTPFKLSLVTTVEPTAIDWELSKVPHITPAGDIHVDNPKAVEKIDINGITYYKYVLDKEVSVDTSGEFYISAFITHPDIDACDSRQETRFPVTVLSAPVVDFVSSGSCAGSEVQFVGSSELESGSAITGWTWDFNDAGAGSHKKDTVYTYKQAGDYNVKLSVVYANGCIGDTVKVVNIKAPLPAPVVKKGVITAFTVQFTWDAVAGATGYEISMDNGVTWVTPSTGNEGLSHTITGLQLAQTVTIKVRVLGSCMPAESAPLSATTMVQEVFIPNSFSPDNNGPAENEYFRVYGNSIKQLRLLIFNQWGEKIFESNNQVNGWDGRYKGKPQPSGVYIYVADVLMENGTRETKKGTINLIR